MGKRYVGERVLQECGEYAEIIRLLPRNMCIVRFDSGVEREAYLSYFRKGTLQKVDDEIKYSVGDTIRTNFGCVAELVEVYKYGWCRVRLDDGYDYTGYLSSFLKGDALPSSIRYCTSKTYKYRVTGEEILNIYYDRRKRNYVGVLRRKNGTRYVRVLD